MLAGGAGNDTLNGGAGVDDYFGEAGNDMIEARDGNAERIACGAGNDQARNDFTDIIAECERGIDGDRDGFSSAVDCNDANPAHPPRRASRSSTTASTRTATAATTSNLDRDGDGFPVPLDCNDTNASDPPGRDRDPRQQGRRELRRQAPSRSRCCARWSSTSWQFGAHYTRAARARGAQRPGGRADRRQLQGPRLPVQGHQAADASRATWRRSSLQRFFRHAQAARRRALTVAITAAGLVGRTYTYRIKIGELPAPSTTCRAPGREEGRPC